MTMHVRISFRRGGAPPIPRHPTSPNEEKERAKKRQGKGRERGGGGEMTEESTQLCVL